jgi:hypothetical protein
VLLSCCVCATAMQLSADARRGGHSRSQPSWVQALRDAALRHWSGPSQMPPVWHTAGTVNFPFQARIKFALCRTAPYSVTTTIPRVCGSLKHLISFAGLLRAAGCPKHHAIKINVSAAASATPAALFRARRASGALAPTACAPRSSSWRRRRLWRQQLLQQQPWGPLTHGGQGRALS